MAFLKNKKNKEDVYVEEVVEEPKNVTQTMIFVEPMIEKLEKKGLTNLLKTDFKTNKRINISNLKDNNIAVQELKPVLNEILTFLHLPLVVSLKVFFADDKNNTMTTQNKAGLYQGGWANKTITINIGRNYSFINVLAIMCHECTHYFLEYNNMNWNDTALNEERTDMMACLIGFSKILSQGYRIIEDVEYYIGYRRKFTSKIGYISNKECEEIREYLLYRRKQIEIEKKRSKEIDNQRNKLEELLNLLKRLNEQLVMIDPLTHIENYQHIKKEDFENFQKAIADYSGLNNKAFIRQCEEALKKAKTREELIEVITVAEEKCGTTVRIMNIFQKLSN